MPDHVQRVTPLVPGAARFHGGFAQASNLVDRLVEPGTDPGAEPFAFLRQIQVADGKPHRRAHAPW